MVPPQSIKLILPPQPHLMSGYAGHVPGYATQFAGSYGNITHELLKNRQIQSKSILKTLDSNEDQDIVISNHVRCPGYTGHIPQYKFIIGSR